MSNKCLIIAVVIFCLLINLVNAESITQNQITISSDKDMYYCEPIFIDDECLIIAKITVTNERTSAVNLDGLSTYTNAVSQITYISSEGSRIPTIAQEVIPQELFLGGETKTYELRFYAKESGKFNFTVSAFQLGTGNLIATTILDPFYNVSVNASTPSYLLTNGININYSISMFENLTDITTGISDGLSSTTYMNYFASMPELYPYIIDGWAFNEYIYGNYVYSYASGEDGEIYGSLDTRTFPAVYGNYYGAYLDGTNDYIRTHIEDEMDIPDLHNFTMCAVINTTFNSAGDAGIITKGITDGFFMTYKLDETIDCEYDGDTGASIVSSTTILNDDVPHVICCRKYGDNIDIWVDGVQEDTGIANIGQIITSNDMFIGSLDLGANKWQGTIRQIGIFNTSLSSATIINMTSTKSIAHIDKGQAIHVYYNHSLTVDADNKNYLMINADVHEWDTIRILSYINMTHPNSTNYLTTRIGSGTTYVLIDSIVETGYDAPFRIWGLQGRPDNLIEDIYLVTATNDSQNPSITDCQVNNTDIECGETVRFQCNATDDYEIYQVWLTLDFHGTPEYHQALNSGDIYYHDRLFSGIYNETKQITFTEANVTDLALNANSTNPSITINYTCLYACVPDWVQNVGICQVNDSRLITYNDANGCGTVDGLPADNGTWVSCNYCDEDVEQELEACLWNGSGYYQETSYIDNNYYTCCVFTSLVSDCSILYSPYNTTTNESCSDLSTDFDLQIDDTVYFGVDVQGKEKVYGKVFINESGQYSCLSYIKTPDGKILQINPDYEQATQNLLGIFGTRYEDREYFQTSNSLANVYWTKENLIIDGSIYVFGVECSSNSSHKISEKTVTVLYENVSAPTTRWFWFINNMWTIVLGTILTVLILLIMSGLLWWAWKK